MEDFNCAEFIDNCHRINRALLVKEKESLQLHFTSGHSTNQAPHQLKAHLQAPRPVLTEMQISAMLG